MKRLLSILLCTLICMPLLLAQHLEKVSPEEVGIDSKMLKYADEAIEEAIANEEFYGAVLGVVRHGKLAYLKAYGDKWVYPKKVPMTTNTVFDMASCSKVLSTTLSALVLLEQGKIRLMDPVEKFIPGFQNWKSEDGKDDKTIRIIHLMTHTSGLPAYASAAGLEKEYGSPCPDSLMSYISRCNRGFKPESRYRYSCLNYITLQHVIENVSGKTLRDFANENVFDVLGLEHTDYLPCVKDEKGNWVNTVPAKWAKGKNDKNWLDIVAPTEVLSTGQVLHGQVHDPLARVLNGGNSGNAGLFSCAEDIAVICAALQNGGEINGKRILGPQTVNLMRTIPTSIPNFGRTVGWAIYNESPTSVSGDMFGPNTYGHTGYTGTAVMIDPDTDTSVIFLTNAVHPKDEHSCARARNLATNVIAAAIRP